MLLLLCGLPGAGKSTWTAAVAARLAPRVVVVEFDDFPADTYSASRDICFAIVSSLVKGDKRQVVSSDSLHYDAYCKVVSRWEAAPVNDRILVCDDNFFYSSMRMPYLALAQEADIPCGIVVFDASLEVCLERNALRIGTPRFVPETVIRDMRSRFERPGMLLPSINGAQHRWEVATTVSSDIDPMDAINMVRAGWKSFMSEQCKLREEQRERDKKRDADAHTTANSLLHQLELRLRGVLSDVLKTHRSDGARLSKLKQQFMTTMKQQLPDADVSNPAQWLSEQEEAFRKLIL